jgi:putative nucleotidyltransferase with HDIG domain
MEQERIHQEILGLENLPTLPGVAVELIRRWNDPDLTIHTVVELLSYDASLSATILRVANSHEHRFRDEIATLNHAAVLLGLNRLRCVTLGVTVLEAFADHKAKWTEDFDPDDFWRHSLAVAVSAEMLAQRFGHPAPEEAFLAGLLHDIGKMGLLATVPEEYVEVIKKASKGDRTLLEYEQQVLSVTHTEIGKWISERWDLPEKFRTAIWRHHQAPSARPIRSGDACTLESLVNLGDYLARRARVGDSGNPFFHHDEYWLQKRVGFESEDFAEFTSELLSRVQEIGRELNLVTPTIQVYLKALQDANRQLADRGIEAESQLELAKERAQFLQTVSSISHLPAHAEIGVDILSRAIDLIRTCLDLRWILLLTTDTARQTVQGVLCTPRTQGSQTFFRVLNVVESKETARGGGYREAVDLLGETVLSNGQRVNLRDEVMSVLQSGNLVATPLSIDDTCQGECLVDASGSKIHQVRQREYFGSLLDTLSKLYERVRLYRNIQRESEAAADALQRESEALRQLFHFERLASVGRLAAGAAHEINNPLAVISGKAQLLLLGEADPARAESLNTVIDQTMRISKIISDLMGYARPAEPEVADTSLQSMIENAFYMAQHRLPDNQVETSVEIPENVTKLHVDARQIEQVLVNLFVNGIQAMDGSGKLSLKVEHHEATGTVSIQVTDTGPGIAAEDLNRIFDPFFTTKREGEGTGLGLAVSHRIVEAHGGRMTVSSRLGKGTTFTIQLPFRGDDEGQAEVVQMPKSKSRKPPAHGGKKRVLIVDDEKQLSDLIRDFLSAAGYVVEQASDGVEAMGYLERTVYDALLLDIRMPRKDGLEVLEDIKGFTTGLPILVITGLASNEELDQATAFGASKILRKPFQLDELLRVVDELTKSRSANNVD